MLPEHCNLQRHGDSNNLLFSIVQAKWFVFQNRYPLQKKNSGIAFPTYLIT